MTDDYYDDYYDEERRWPLWAAGVGGLVLVSAAALWFVISAIGGDGETSDVVAGVNPTLAPVATDAPVADTVADRTDTTTTTITTTTATTVPSTDSTVPPTTVAAGAPATVGQDVQTLPDRSTEPVLALFDDDLIVLSGAVPSAAAAERLRLFALSYGNGSGAQVASFLTVDDTVALNIGFRLVEVDSVEFNDGLPVISSEYAAELDRIVALMTSLPNVVVDVVGHTGDNDDAANELDLSARRAQASVDYLVSQGIEPDRLSARAAGSTDLLTLNSDEAAEALNRRTEFVVFGLLVDDPVPG